MGSLEEIPASWYALERSENVPSGTIAAVSFLNRDYVVYRDSREQIHAIGAYCPHRGSHLGKDGIILREGIACRSHQKVFDHQRGNCKNDPLCPSIHQFETCESNGLIMVWYDPDHSPSTWQMQPFHPLNDGRYSKIFWKRLPDFRTHVSILLQDAFDNGHFEAVHRLMRPRTRVYGERNLLRTHTRAEIKAGRLLDVFKRQAGRHALSRLATWILNSSISAISSLLVKHITLEVNLSSEVHGMGLVAYEASIGGIPYLLLSAGTPKDANNVSVFLGICTPKLPFRFIEKFFAGCLLREVAQGYEDDRSRWEGQLRSGNQHTSSNDEGIAFFERVTSRKNTRNNVV
jgi:nitrite reductase/ring-hydroxylating ferredoxin subunit